MKNTNKLLQESILSQDVYLVKQLLDNFSFDPWDDSIVLSAIEYHQISIIKLLVDYGFDLNHDCYSGGYYPLEKAIEIGYSFEQIATLLSFGATANICSCSGTPLMSAIERNDEGIIDLLIDAKADVNIQIEGGFTALMCAALNGHFSTTEKLIRLGANPDIITIDDFPRTALVCAAEYRHKEVFDYLFPLTHSKEQRILAIKYFA
jgi:Ankyrin repeats (3 copies)